MKSEPPSQALRPAVFFDRDGVLNHARVVDGMPLSPRSAEEFILYPEAKALLAQLRQSGFVNVVVTNQPEVGRGTLDENVVEQMHTRLRTELAVDKVCVCYDDGRTTTSFYRKPEPGMILEAAKELAIDLAASFVVGDRWKDIEAGNRAGCRTIWLDRGYREGMRATAHFRVETLAAAIEIILDRKTTRGKP